MVVWLRLTQTQRELYRSFLKSDAVAAALNRTGSPLAAVTVLKKICDHPGLLTARAAAAAVGRRIGGAGSEEEEEEEEEELNSGDDSIGGGDSDGGGEDSPTSKPKRTPPPGKEKGKSGSSKGGEATLCPPSAPAAPLDPAALALEEKLLTLIAERGPAASCKTQFAPKLVARLVAEGHRVLVFSQSRVMLDIVGAALLKRMEEEGGRSGETRGVEKGGGDKGGGGEEAERTTTEPFLRIDGTIASAAARQAIVARFQEAKAGVSPPVLLLTTGVGALGLTLTAATRVVLVEPG